MEFLKKILSAGAAKTIETIGATIDRIDKSDEKLAMQLEFQKLLIELEAKTLDYENKLLESQTSIVAAEAKGESWLQRNWRPVLMLLCVFIVFNNYVLVPYFKAPYTVLDNNIWDLIEIGVGGYVAGRSLEKVSSTIGQVLKKK